MIKDIVLKNRSYRRFYEDKKVSVETLRELIAIGHATPSAANRQPIRFKLVCDEQENSKVFECLGWAGYYKDWDGPKKGERPSAYIIMTAPKNVSCQWDEGIIGQTILLAATEIGMGGCFIGNIQKDKLGDIIGLQNNMEVKIVIVLGYPKEQVVIDIISQNGDVKYYRDENQIQHVPKIDVDEIIL